MEIGGNIGTPDMVSEILQRFQKLWETVSKNSEAAKAKMKEVADKSRNTSESDFKKGDLVILKASANPPGSNRKLTQHRGPAVILEVNFPNLTIRLRENNVVVDKTVNVSQVRKHHGKLKDEDLVDTRCFVCDRYHIKSRGRKQLHWIQCETCFKWFHQQCVKIPSKFDLKKDSWYCDQCTPTGNVNNINVMRPESIKIASWNVNGVRSWVSKNGLEYLSEYQPDILMLQEIKIGKSGFPAKATSVDGYKLYYEGSKKPGYAGVAMYCKQVPIKVMFGFENPQLDCEGRVLTAEFERFFIINVYAPFSGEYLDKLDCKIQFMTCLKQHLTTLQGKKPTFLVGDMNVAFTDADIHQNEIMEMGGDVSHIPGCTYVERTRLSTLTSNGHSILNDIEGKTKYTFWQTANKRVRDIGWRVDYIITPDEFYNFTLQTQQGIRGSDHCPLMAVSYTQQ